MSNWQPIFFINQRGHGTDGLFRHQRKERGDRIDVPIARWLSPGTERWHFQVIHTYGFTPLFVQVGLVTSHHILHPLYPCRTLCLEYRVCVWVCVLTVEQKINFKRRQLKFSNSYLYPFSSFLFSRLSFANLIHKRTSCQAKCKRLWCNPSYVNSIKSQHFNRLY
jgi:hypothetical protein